MRRLARRRSCAPCRYAFPWPGTSLSVYPDVATGARSPGTPQRAHDFDLNQDDVAAFLSRVGLDGERMVDVFSLAQDAAMLPL